MSLRPRRRDAGMATAEFAVALPAIVLVLALAVTVVGAALDQVRCVDAARAGARAAARGDTQAAVVALARDLAPGGATVQVQPRGDRVTVVVSGSAPAGLWPASLAPRSSATAAREQTAGDSILVVPGGESS